MREHGTPSCYSMGCRMPECREAHRVYEMNRRRKRWMGKPQPIPSAPWRRLIRELTLPRMTLAQLSEQTGLTPSTLETIRDGRYEHVSPATHAALTAYVESLPSASETA